MNFESYNFRFCHSFNANFVIFLIVKINIDEILNSTIYDRSWDIKLRYYKIIYVNYITVSLYDFNGNKNNFELLINRILTKISIKIWLKSKYLFHNIFILLLKYFFTRFWLYSKPSPLINSLRNEINILKIKRMEKMEMRELRNRIEF